MLTQSSTTAEEIFSNFKKGKIKIKLQFARPNLDGYFPVKHSIVFQSRDEFQYQIEEAVSIEPKKLYRNMYTEKDYAIVV